MDSSRGEGVSRHGSSRRRAERRQKKIRRFAERHGYMYAPDPTMSRRAGDIFGSGNVRAHIDWLGVPGPAGFEAGTFHATTVDEYDGRREGWTYAVFALRDSYPRTVLSLVGHPRSVPNRLRFAEDRPMPGAPKLTLRTARPEHPLLHALLGPDLAAALVEARRPWAVELVGHELFLYTYREGI